MIKHFTTAIGAASGSAPAAKGSKGGNAIIWIVGLGVVVFAAYKFIESRNRMVVQQND